MASNEQFTIRPRGANRWVVFWGACPQGHMCHHPSKSSEWHTCLSLIEMEKKLLKNLVIDVFILSSSRAMMPGFLLDRICELFALKLHPS